MPTHVQGTTNVVITDRKLGSSATNDLKSIFSTSPINKGDMSPEDVKKAYQDDVLNGVTNDGGHTFGEFSKDYSDAPDYGDVGTGGGGAPASAFVPNPSSPGEGEGTNASAQPKAPDGFGTVPSSTPGSGVGSKLSPKAASAAISAQTLGDYGLGKSSS
tara:strand:+ start:2136 stop:2612 length:477 start_codon:yes stop_codon:yes gene_type:complete